MAAWVGAFFAVSALLGVSGALKAWRPAPAAAALGALGLPSSTSLVRIGGAVEVVVAVGALLRGDRPFALLVAASYLLFAMFVVAALWRRVPLASCGCFGGDETPPTLTHVGVDLAAAGFAGLVAVRPTGGMADVAAMGEGPLVGLLFLVLTGTAAYLAYAALTLLPRLDASVRRSARGAA